MSMTRREFLKGTAAYAGLGLLPLGYTGAVLRPPGAGPEFEARCIRCGKCMEACPYDSIRFLDVTAGGLAHTPYIDPLVTPCYLCLERRQGGKDYPLGRHLLCGEACPTGALRKIVNKREVLASVPYEYKIGVSVINRKLCLAWQYDSCGECYYNCPLRDKALLDRPPDMPAGHLGTGIRPHVDPRACIGCGMCNFVCPVKERVAKSEIRREFHLDMFEQRYVGMVRSVMSRAGAGEPLPAIRVVRAL